jgi:hypothetical protein
MTKEAIQAQIDLIDEIKVLVDDNYLFVLNQKQNELTKKLEALPMYDNDIKTAADNFVNNDKTVYEYEDDINRHREIFAEGATWQKEIDKAKYGTAETVLRKVNCSNKKYPDKDGEYLVEYINGTQDLINLQDGTNSIIRWEENVKCWYEEVSLNELLLEAKER